MIQEAMAMTSGNSHIQEEMREVEEELEEDSSIHDAQNPRGQTISLEALEEGMSKSRRMSTASPRHSPRPSPAFPLSGKTKKPSIKESTRNTLQFLTSPVFAQAFVLTFLGEWGDRSQVTTIAMAGAHSVPVIAFGTIVGHGLCTFGAVMGGRYLSTKISVKHSVSHTQHLFVL